MSMLELICPECSNICPTLEQVQTDDSVIYTAECECGCEFERKDIPGDVVITRRSGDKV